MKITVHEFLTLDGVMQSPGSPEEDPGNGFDRGGWQVPFTGDDDFDRIVAGWQNTSVISGDVIEAVRALRERPGRELQVHGSWKLVQTLHNTGLIDEYRLLMLPIVIGTGKRLFDADSAPSGFTPVDGEMTNTGTVYQVLRPTTLETGAHVVHDGMDTAKLAT